MTDITNPLPVTLRTTSDADGSALDVVAASGASPAEALASLRDEARRLARRIDRERRVGVGAAERGQMGQSRPVPDLSYEVADVRLAAGPPGADHGERWAAYGTLRSTPQSS